MSIFAPTWLFFSSTSVRFPKKPACTAHIKPHAPPPIIIASKSVCFAKFAVMAGVAQISEFGKILIFLITGIVMVCLGLFDVEMVFVFPWAIVFGSHEINDFEPRWGWLALTEMFIFLGVLALGLAYVWAKGDLDWIKARPVIPTTEASVPASLYDKVNIEQSAYLVRPFTPDPEPAAEVPAAPGAATPPPIRKPMFKPIFKKPGNE